MDCSFIGWCALDQNAQAAWVQAIFSVVGIGVAIAIPALQHWLQSRRKKIDDLARARALALTLLPTLDAWDARLNRLERYLDGFVNGDRNYPSWDYVQKMLSPGAETKYLVPRSHSLGEAAPAVQAFFVGLVQAREIGMHATDREERPWIAQDPLPAELLSMVRRARARLRAAVEAAKRLFD